MGVESTLAADEQGPVDFWTSLSPTYKIVVAGIAALLLIGLFALAFGLRDTSPIKVPLLGGLSFTPTERNAAIQALQAANLNDYEFNGSTILVAKGRENAYLGALAQKNALPGNFDRAFQDYAENQRTWWMSNEEAARFFRVARERRLGQIIETFPGVEQAAVNVTAAPQLGMRPRGPVKASVKLTTSGNQRLNPQIVTQIKNLVANSIEGLSAGDVYVAGDMFPGMSGGAGGGGGFGEECVDTTLAKLKNEMLQNKQAYAECIEKDIRKLFSHLPGVEVVVNVEVEPEKNITEHSVTFVKGAVAEQDTQTSTSEMNAGGPGGAEPGVRTNVDLPGVAPGSANQGAAVAGHRSTDNDENSITKFNNNRTETTKEIQDFIPKTVGVSVKVPRSFLAPGTPGPDGAAAPAELNSQEMIEAIANLKLPGLSPEGIKIIPYTAPKIEEPKPPEVTIMDYVSDYGNTALLALVGIFALILALIIARRTPVPDLPELPPETAEELEEIVLPPISDESVRRFESMKMSVTQLIAQEPEIAAGLIRRWVQTPD